MGRILPVVAARVIAGPGDVDAAEFVLFADVDAGDRRVEEVEAGVADDPVWVGGGDVRVDDGELAAVILASRSAECAGLN
jgi:hypothetical protein